LVSYNIDPFNSHTCNNLGLIYKRKNDIDKGIKYLSEAIIIDPYNSGAITNLAIAFETKGDFSKAGDLILKALELAPDKKKLLFTASNIAVEIAKSGESEKAILIWEQLIKFDSGNTNNWYNLALYYQFNNRKKDAIRCFKVVQKKLPKDEQVLHFLVKLYGEIGNYNEAISYCDKLLSIDGSNIKAISWKAQFLHASGEGTKAIQYLSPFVETNPMNDNLALTLAKIYSSLGHQEDAIKMIVKAKNAVLKTDPNNKEKIVFLRQLFNKYQKLKEEI
jgi:tetratricopeptide (TPR) repeat protein